jgi:hypothetical protein
MTPSELIHEAERRGLRLEPRGDKLAVIPASRCPDDFAAVLLKHKAALLAYLHAGAISLPADCLPWLHVAKQVLAGEFDGCDKSMRESLTIGLRGIHHPIAGKAMEYLKGKKPA